MSNFRRWVFVGGFVVLILLLSFFMYLAAVGDIENSLVSAISSSIIALVTLAYVYLTFELVNETRRARVQEVQPAFSVDLEPASIGSYGVAIKNIGNGPAKDLEATITLNPGDQETEIEYKTLAPDDYAPVAEPFEESINEEIAEMYDEIEVNGTYTDIFGNTSQFSGEYKLQLLEKGDSKSLHMKRENTDRHMRDLVRELRKIRRELKSFKRPFG